MKTLAICIIAVLLVGSCTYGCMEADRKYLEQQRAWFDLHQCKPHSYSAQVRTYRCDDGTEYTWWDIPRLQP